MAGTSIPVALAVAVCGIVSMPQGPPGRGEKTADPTTVTVPLELVAGRPIVSVQVNGRGPFRFLIDPLATMTRLDAAVADQLKVHRPPQAGGQAPAAYRIDLQIGDVAVRDVEMEPIDMVAMAAGFGPTARPNGILGGSVWNGRLLTLDFGSWKVGLASGALPPPNGVSVFSIDPEHVASGIPVVVAGNQLTATLDVLFAGGLVLPASPALRFPLDKGPVLVRVLPTRGDAITVNEMTLAANVEILSVVLARPALLTSRQVRMPTLGTAWLGSFVVIIDAANRRAQLVPRRAS